MGHETELHHKRKIQENSGEEKHVTKAQPSLFQKHASRHCLLWQLAVECITRKTRAAPIIFYFNCIIYIYIYIYIYILKDSITPNLTWKLPKNNYDKIIKIPLYTKPLKFNSKRHLNHCTVQNKLKSKKIPLTQVKCFSTVQQKLERVKFTSFNSIMTIVSHKKNHVAYHVH
jgi:hypothetical protein